MDVGRRARRPLNVVMRRRRRSQQHRLRYSCIHSASSARKCTECSDAVRGHLQLVAGEMEHSAARAVPQGPCRHGPASARRCGSLRAALRCAGCIRGLPYADGSALCVAFSYGVRRAQSDTARSKRGTIRGRSRSSGRRVPQARCAPAPVTSAEALSGGRYGHMATPAERWHLL